MIQIESNFQNFSDNGEFLSAVIVNKGTGQTPPPGKNPPPAKTPSCKNPPLAKTPLRQKAPSGKKNKTSCQPPSSP